MLKRTDPTIADILHLAADKFLASSEDDYSNEEYSCSAVSVAIRALGLGFGLWSKAEAPSAARRFLRQLGCPVDSYKAFGGRAFDSFEARQGARYAWLKFAAQIAEEWGV